MIAIIFEIAITLIFAVITALVFGIFRALPFVTGLVTALILLLIFPGLSNIIPGEPKPSAVAVIGIIEFVTLILTFCPQTSGPMILFSCLMFINTMMALLYHSFECASWQKAIFVTVIYLLVTTFIIGTNLGTLEVERVDSRNIIASIIVAVMYAASVGTTIFIILGGIWEKYISIYYSEGFKNSYDRISIAFIIGIMAVTGVGSIIRDRVCI